VELPQNEPVLDYAPGSAERAALRGELAAQCASAQLLPLVIDGERVETGRTSRLSAPHRHSLHLATRVEGGVAELDRAIAAALRAKPAWAATPLEERAAIFERAASLLAGPFRQRLNAATLLGQSKTPHQAEIDSACELIDFLRFNVQFARQIAAEQPVSGPGVWNVAETRPLEGFVFAATPFNFTAIAGNLPTAPALMGNTVVWKPSANALYSAHFVMDLLVESGLPPGVINLVMGPPELVSNACIDHPDFAGIHFTGSTAVFQSIWRRIGENIGRYRGYPRIVGETGGKDFVFAHVSADLDALAVALVRGAYEYQGQKCSAASRAYIPKSIWAALKDRLVGHIQALRMGDVADFRNFMGAVIDGRAHARLAERVAAAKRDPACSVLCGGGPRTHDTRAGWFVEPTLIETSDPRHPLLAEELFGPVLTVWVYPDGSEAEALALCDQTSPYGLTGALFARDRAFIETASDALRLAAGNFYINDKPTGAVVAQQPFGGARGSGTNDKAGSLLNLLRWVSPRIIKETFAPPRAVPYPFMAAE
jgi:1-pyrroline-5-carboxylate dehydrogenase